MEVTVSPTKSDAQSQIHKMCTRSHNYPQKNTTRTRQKKWGLTDVEPEQASRRGRSARCWLPHTTCPCWGIRQVEMPYHCLQVQVEMSTFYAGQGVCDFLLTSSAASCDVIFICGACYDFLPSWKNNCGEHLLGL